MNGQDKEKKEKKEKKQEPAQQQNKNRRAFPVQKCK